jgi:hypothetical protein
MTDDPRWATPAERAAYRLLLKFHRETSCGRPFHWVECDHFVGSWGFRSWQAWLDAVDAREMAALDANESQRSGVTAK